MESETPVEVLCLDYTCDKCERGRMRPDGVSPPSQPVTYPHKCTVCGHTASLHKRYPDIIYRIAETTVALLN
jgi:hypothetical protein